MTESATGREKATLLVVDDDVELRDLARQYLQQKGYDVVCVEDGITMDAALEAHDVDLVILDLMLPGEDGLSIAKRLKRKSAIPIIMVSAQGEDVDRIVGLEVGADDYMTKPFEVMELLARISAVMRRTLALPEGVASQVHEFGDLRVDTANAAVWRGEERLRLSMMEYALLHYLVRHPTEVLDRRRILDEVWGSDPEIGPRTVDVHVAWLRKKLGDNQDSPRWIRTVHGKGYAFEPE